MQILKLAAISFIVFFLLITGISLFIPSHIRISKAVDMNAPKEKIMAQLRNPANWKLWYPGTDSLQLLMINGEPKGVLSNAQTMRGLIITSANDSSVTATNAGPGSKSTITGWNVIGNDSSALIVQWYMDFKLHWYPWEKFSSLLFEKRYGPTMELGLHNLKELVEK